MPDWTRRAGQAEALQAIWAEMRFFNRIMADHGRVLRGMLDLGEDGLIREGDHFTKAFASLQEKTEQAHPDAADRITPLVVEAAPLVEELIAFKQELLRLLDQCRVQAIFPPELVAHVRREALWYLGLLEGTLGRPTPLRRELKLPDGEVRALLLPRHLIGRVPADLNTVSEEYDLFWVHIQQEHAAVLAQHTRPQVQQHLHRALTAWEKDLGKLLRQGEGVFAHLRRAQGLRPEPALRPAVARYNREVDRTVTRFRNHLLELVEELRQCRVPTGQTNFWPALAHHMRTEADYLADALRRIGATAEGRTLADGLTHPSVEEE